jgi:hypothetical protein
MRTIKQSLKSYSFRYDFQSDGGTIGLFLSPFFIPEGCCPVSVNVHTSTTLVDSGGGLSAVSIGIESNNTLFLNGSIYTNFVSGEVQTIQSPMTFWNSIPSPGERLTFSIEVENLTAGVLNITLIYLEF